MPVLIYKSSEDLIDEQSRIAAFWTAGNKSLRLAERFIAAIETLEARGVLHYDIQPDEAVIEILEVSTMLIMIRNVE